jgi:hypothetical protein
VPKCNYCLREMKSHEDHRECFIQFHMRFHNKSREQIMELFRHVLRVGPLEDLLKDDREAYQGVSRCSITEASKEITPFSGDAYG